MICDRPSIPAAYAAMHRRHAAAQRARAFRLIGAGLGLAFAAFMVWHLAGDLGARVAASACGAC